MKAQAIIPAAGSGTRMKSSVAKLLVKINGIPMLAHTLRIFERTPKIDSVVLVVSKALQARIKALVAHYKFKKVKHIVLGGKTRQQSVFKGLCVLDDDTKFVVIHDGARPCVDKKDIEKAVAMAAKVDCVSLAVPIKPTVKAVNPKTLMVEKTLERRRLWEVQTPQVCKVDRILKAHKRFKGSESTDDAALIERLGGRVKILPGSYKNIKITTTEDLVLAREFLK